MRDESHPGGRAYVHPRSEDCILGGTLERGSWSTEPDPAETTAILERCADIVPALAGAEVIESVAGLRPGRAEVRLERDDSLLPVPVVHDYGHGGAGITIGWGCAQDVAALVGTMTSEHFGPGGVERLRTQDRRRLEVVPRTGPPQSIRVSVEVAALPICEDIAMATAHRDPHPFFSPAEVGALLNVGPRPSSGGPRRVGCAASTPPAGGAST